MSHAVTFPILASIGFGDWIWVLSKDGRNSTLCGMTFSLALLSVEQRPRTSDPGALFLFMIKSFLVLFLEKGLLSLLDCPPYRAIRYRHGHQKIDHTVGGFVTAEDDVGDQGLAGVLHGVGEHLGDGFAKGGVRAA